MECLKDEWVRALAEDELLPEEAAACRAHLVDCAACALKAARLDPTAALRQE